MPYSISYFVTTYNKLPYLQQMMARLVAARQPDEEIVVCDGGSTDGTADYLRGLYEAGQIQQFVSERDKGEAHGFNKGMLMARGELLKLITDDDAFCYPAIREARDFMLANPQVDALVGNTGLVHLEDLSYATLYEDVAANFERWRVKGDIVWFIGLPLIIRRSVLALTGLFNTQSVQVDTEFTYRITSLNINLAWSTALLAMRIENPQSNFRLLKEGKGLVSADAETERMRFFYDRRVSEYGLLDYIKYNSGWPDKIKDLLRPAKRKVYNALGWEQYQGFTKLPTTLPAANKSEIETAFLVCDAFMADYNATQKTDYVYRVSGIQKAMQT